MKSNFSTDQKQRARRADLYDYLLRNHRSQFKIEGTSLHPLDNHSLSIKKGYSGYKDFATDETGNSIDFLTKHMGYTLVDAVKALCGDEYTIPDQEENTHIDVSDAKFLLPDPCDNQYRQLYAYLIKQRGIPSDVVQMLVDQKVIYQEKSHNNIVFVNKEKTLAEIRGTNSYKSFHGILKGSAYKDFWWFKSVPGKEAEVAYVCEAAIDAISLYCIHKKQNMCIPALYCSIVGVANQQRIDRIKDNIKTILAVDNDEAGQACRDRNSDLEYIIPSCKDWNDDWRAMNE